MYTNTVKKVIEDLNFNKIKNEKKQEILALAQDLHLKYKYKDIRELVEKEGYILEGKDSSIDYTDKLAMITVKKIYYIKNDDVKEDEDFLISHELSHGLLGHKSTYFRSEVRAKPKNIMDSLISIYDIKNENEANYLSLALLIPDDVLDSKLMEFDINEDLAKELNVSMFILNKRIEQLQDIQKYYNTFNKENRDESTQRFLKELKQGKYGNPI